MPHFAHDKSFDPLGRSIRPSTVFALVLASVFVTEGLIMLALPYFRRAGHSVLLESIADAAILTGLISPAVWWLLVRPLRLALAERGRLLDRMFDIQENERASIARELHDEMGQQLTAIQLRLRALEGLVQDPAGQRQLEDLHQLSVATHANIRRVSRGLRPSTLDQFGLATALERLCTDLNTSAGPSVRFSMELPDASRPDAEIESAMYRVCQEAMTNAIQHGHPKVINVHLRQDARELVLTVADDGEGFDVSVVGRDSGAQGLFGLLSMRERIRLLGGEFAVQSKVGSGTTIVARFPVHASGG